MAEHRELSEDELGLIMTGHIAFQALRTGLDTEVFRFLAQCPGATVDELAAATKLQPYPLSVLLGCLRALRLVRDEGGALYNARVVTDRLIDGPGAHAGYIELEHHIVYPAMHYLTDAVREGTNAGLAHFPGPGKSLYERLADHPELQGVLHRALNQNSAAARPGLLEVLADGAVASTGHLLDVGGGDGTNAIALVQAYPGLRVTVFDLPSVVERARVNVEAAGLTDQITMRAGDFFAEDLPPGVDAVLFANLLPIFAPETAEQLVIKAYQCLRPGGALIVVGPMQDDSEDWPPFAMLQSAYFLAVSSGEGRFYPWRAYEEWMRAAGFSRYVRRSGLPLSQGVHLAIK